MEKRAEIPLRVSDGLVFADGAIDARPVVFLIDTGADRTILNEAEVERLGLARDEWVSSRNRGIGGYERHRNATIGSIELGGLRLRRRGTEARTSVSVAPLPVLMRPGSRAAGLLGLDYLSMHDIEIDLRNRRMALYRVTGCQGAFLPWRGPYAAVPAERAYRSVLLLPARVNGAEVFAEIDTGSSRTVISRLATARAGVNPAMLQRDPPVRISGLGPDAGIARAHLFADVRVAGYAMAEPRILVMQLPAPAVGMLLGAAWLQSHAVWLSWATSQVFVAPEP